MKENLIRSSSDKINLILEYLLIVLVTIITVLGFMGIISRYVIDRPLTWSEELIRLFFIWIVFIGASVAVKRNAHLRMLLFIRVLAKKASILDIIANVIMIIFAVILILGGINFIYSVKFQLSANIRFPLLLFYIPLSASGIIMILHIVSYFMKMEESK